MRTHSDSSSRYKTQVRSILFLDIAGFSLCATQETPESLSEYLRETLTAILATVHRYGAVAEKTQGDGVVCFFEDQKGSGDSVRNALECAIQIQLDHLQCCLASSAAGRPVCPLRIGINTAPISVADIAGNGFHELTLVGHGANYAKRLEEACDDHLILCGSATYEALISHADFKSDFTRRLIKIKHFPDRVFTAYEWNPFRENPALLHAAELAVREYLGLRRSEPRYRVNPEGHIRVSTENTDGVLVDFSRNGLGMKLTEFYAKGVTLQLHLNSEAGGLSEQCRERGLSPVEVEVCWAKPLEDGDTFLHGTRIRNLNADQKQNLFQYLRQALSDGLALKATKAA